jgi:hypothetical protein
MFADIETVSSNAVTGATIISLGFMSEQAAERVRDALEGKTFMNFEVTCAVAPGGPLVSISTEYDESPVEILAFAMNVMAGAS